MKRLIRASLMITLLITSSSVCRAEPTPAIRYLIDTPISILDFGIYGLEQHLEKRLESSGYRGLTTVSYSWTPNRILISLKPFSLVQGDPGRKPHKLEPLIELKNEDEAKDQCKRFVGIIRQILGVDPVTGKIFLTGDTNSFLKVFFSHAGYQHSSQPKNLFDELDNITEISVEMPPHFYQKEGKPIRARAPLLGTEILFSDN